MTADITTGLQLSYKCSDVADATISDSGPNALDLTVTASGAFPTRTSADGRTARQFSRTAAETPTNYGKATITSAQFQAIIGANNGNAGENTIAAWVRRSSSDTVAGHADCIFALTGTGNGGVLADIQNLAVEWQRANSKFHVVAYAADSSTFSWTSTYVLNAIDVWHHIAVVTRNNVAGTSYFFDLYVDGVLVETSASQHATFALAGTYPAGGAVITMGALSLANGTPSQNQMGAYVTNVCAYSRALAAGDVAELATAGMIDPTSFAQAIAFGTPQVQRRSLNATPGTATITTAKTKTGAAVALANSKSQI